MWIRKSKNVPRTQRAKMPGFGVFLWEKQFWEATNSARLTATELGEASFDS